MDEPLPLRETALLCCFSRRSWKQPGHASRGDLSIKSCSVNALCRAHLFPHRRRAGGGSARARPGLSPARGRGCAARPAPAAMGRPWGGWLLPIGLLQLLAPAGACPCRDPKLCQPVTGPAGSEVRGPGPGRALPAQAGPGPAAAPFAAAFSPAAARNRLRSARAGRCPRAVSPGGVPRRCPRAGGRARAGPAVGAAPHSAPRLPSLRAASQRRGCAGVREPG